MKKPGESHCQLENASSLQLSFLDSFWRQVQQDSTSSPWIESSGEELVRRLEPNLLSINSYAASLETNWAAAVQLEEEAPHGTTYLPWLNCLKCLKFERKTSRSELPHIRVQEPELAKVGGGWAMFG